MALLDTKYSVCYMGHSSIKSYVAESTLPWIIAEIELSRRLQNVVMHLTAEGIELKRDFVSRIPSSSGNSANTPDGLESLSEDLMKFDDLDIMKDEIHLPVITESILNVSYHNVMHTKKMQRNKSSFFILITRESKEKPILCHAFKADVNLVTIVSDDVEKRIMAEGKTGMQCLFKKLEMGDAHQTHSDNDCVRFEVMLIGIVNLKNPEPPQTLIDQAVAEFDERYKQLEERQKENGEGSDANSHIPVSPGYIDSGSPTNSFIDDSREGSMNLLQEMRKRCSSFNHGTNERPVVRRRQRHCSEPSTIGGDMRKTRIRLFQIGHNAIKMVCPNKSVRTAEIEFSDISCCMQGIKRRNHFGVIANGISLPRHGHSSHGASHNSSKKIVCYVFKCDDESVCEEIMQSTRQAFATCFNDTSPMQDFELLCKEINEASPEDALSVAKRKMRELNDSEARMIKAQIMEINPKNQSDKISACMAALRQLFELKHIKHLQEAKTADDLNLHSGSHSPGSKFGNIKSKAMLSFGNLMHHLSDRHVTSPVQKLKHISGTFSSSVPSTPQKSNSAVVGNSPVSQSATHGLGRTRDRSISLGSKTQSLEFAEKAKSEPPYLFYHEIFHSITNTGSHAKSSVLSSNATACSKQPEKPKRRYETVEDIRRAWKWAVSQLILLNKLDSISKSKPTLNGIPKGENHYADLSPVPEEMENVWMEIFRLSINEKAELDSKVLHAAVCKGVMGSYRGRVWKLLRLHCHSSERTEAKSKKEAYQKLLDNLTPYQHAILIDIGRTFPTHPMFSQLLGPGQLSLYNVLKAYSLLDKEVGYCQGLSFIAGVLLMHTCIEDEAYQLLDCIMHEIGCRSMYLPDMTGMKLAVYKMTRLLHDEDNDTFKFFDKHDVTMMLVATPWFLTMYASTFPMGFVARVFDMVFADGTAALFKVGICLLRAHKPKLLQFDDFEDIVNYIKNEIPQSSSECLNTVIGNAMEMSVELKLQAYEVEYCILCDELPIFSYHEDNRKHLQDQIHCLENVNYKVTESNCDLLRQLQEAQQKVAMLQKQLRDVTRA